MSWSKLWDEILGDPKLLRGARMGAKELELLPWLQAFASKAKDGGRLTIGGTPAAPVDIAHLLPKVSAKRVARAMESLEHLGILTRDTDGTLRFARWDARQARKPSDDPSAVRERIRRHREKAKREGWASRSISETQRRRVLTRDERKCRKCGATNDLEIDHVVPISKGGTSDDANLQVLCRPCNREKLAQHDSGNFPSGDTQGNAQVETRGNATEKRREEESREETDNSVVTGYGRTLRIALNRAIAVRFGEQPAPVTGGEDVAERFRTAGVPPDFAVAQIEAGVAKFPHARPPRSLRYFATMVLDAWAQRAEADEAARGDLTARREAAQRVDWWVTFLIRENWSGKWHYRQQREDFIAGYVASGRIPDEGAFRREWDLLRQHAPGPDLYQDLVTTSEAGLRAAVHAAFAKGAAAEVSATVAA